MKQECKVCSKLKRVKEVRAMANEQNLKPIRDSQRARELQEKAAKTKERENIAKRKNT